MPLPFGAGVNFMNIWQDYNVDSVQLTPLVPVPFPTDGVQVSPAEGKGYSIDGRLDLWLLPFLNIYGVAGYTKGESRATATMRASGDARRSRFMISRCVSAPIAAQARMARRTTPEKTRSLPMACGTTARSRSAKGCRH